MRSRIILLLAVFSHHITAGPVGHNGRLAQQHNKFPRFYNISVTPSTVNDILTSSPVPLPSPSLSSPTDALSDTTTAGHSLASKFAEGATVVASALSESSPAALPITHTTAIIQSATPLTISSLSSRPSTSAIGVTFISSNAESRTSTPLTGIDGAESQSPTTIQSLAPTQPTSSLSRSSASPASSATPVTPVASQPTNVVESESTTSSKPTLTFKKELVQLGSSNAAEFAPVTAASNAPAPTIAGVQYPTAEKGNGAMAQGFNQIYKTLIVASRCNANDNNQAVACISGELAQCQADGTYVLKSCPDGQSCYALPKASGSPGISVECAVPSDAAAKLSGASGTSSTAAVASQVASVSQASVAPSSGKPQDASTVLPQTQSVQIPVQQISSISQTAATSPDAKSVLSAQSSLEATPVSPSSVALSSRSVQQTSSKLPETGSEQLPVQRTSPVPQTMTTPHSQVQVSTPPTNSLGSAPTQNGGSQSSAVKEAPTALADSRSSSRSQAEAVQGTVQTLSSFPPVQATAQTQAEVSTLASNTFSSAPAQTQQGSPAHRSTASESASAAPSATTAVGGPLFSIPNLTPSSSQATETQHGEATRSSATPTQATSTATGSPSILAQQQTVPMETSLTLPPHFAQPVSSTPISSDNGGGITIVPLGAAHTHSALAMNEKLAVKNASAPSPSPTLDPSPVPNPNAFGTPVYITVTVTTTAYGHNPSP